MTPAVSSLVALAVAIVLSCTSRINVGVLAIAFAWLIGVYHAGMRPEAVAAAFPVALFLTLAGVTLLFALAETNGALERVTHQLVRVAGGGRRALPILFFIIAGAVSSVGPGAISAVALVAPLAMSIGGRAGVPRFLTALMVANGANAGNLSPVSAVGVIANTKIAEAGLGAQPGLVWFSNFAAHALVGLVAYAVLVRGRDQDGSNQATPAGGEAAPMPRLTSQQKASLAVIALWVVAVVGFGLHVGLAAFGAAACIALVGAGDEAAAVKRMPWNVILMVCGISVLIGVLERSGGMDLFSTLLSNVATPTTINGSIAFITGLISTWSSTSGVVLPAFLPTVPALVAKVGGGDPLAVALSINVGSSLVDVSPLSTLGALCVAAVSDVNASRRLFRQLMIWGLSMAVVAAVLCQLFAGVLARM